jgi:heptaprenyl diphosphate synthase
VRHPSVNSLDSGAGVAAELGAITVPLRPAKEEANGQPSAAAELEIGLAPALAADSPLHASCSYVVATPGKRFRAALVQTAARYGPQPEQPVVERCAVAVELFHAATLAHDDVVDDGQLRRGKATIGAHAGSFAASLAGGWLFARAVELVAEAGREAIGRFAETTSVVCEGEMLETRELYDVGRSRDAYLAAIEAKTASLIGFASWLGSHLGGADPELSTRLRRYGEGVGMAFQIADDILDLVADPELTGKTPGSDLRQGVYTLPTIYALQTDSVLRDGLLEGPEAHELPPLVARIRASGAIDAALEECDAWIDGAIAALPPAPSAPHEQRLVSLARGIRKRLVETAAL